MKLDSLVQELKNRPTRPRIGLALAGGAARGLAHIGVLQVLEEVKLPVDLIVGTSAGAIVGSLWASGMSAQKMHRIARATEWWFLAKPVVFGTGLLHSHGIESWLDRIFPVDKFADLPIQFIATATDFRTGELVVLDTGDVTHAVRISCTVPGVYQAVEYQGRALVDGGLVQNLPAQVARAFGAEILIAVDLHSDVLEHETPQTVLVSLIHSANILQRQQELAQLRLVDLVVQPKVGEFSAVSFKSVDQFVERGRVAAQAKLEELTSLLGKVVGGN